MLYTTVRCNMVTNLLGYGAVEKIRNRLHLKSSSLSLEPQ